MPVMPEMKTHAEVPPMPPPITLTQARNLTSTLPKGDPEQGSLIGDTARQLLHHILPGD